MPGQGWTVVKVMRSFLRGFCTPALRRLSIMR